MVALSTVQGALDCWLTIYSILTSFFLVTATSGSGMSGRSCGCILAGPIPRWWMDAGRSNWREASPGLLPAKCTRQRIPANSSLTNMAANLPESRIPPITAGWSWHLGPALKPPKYVFSTRIHLLEPWNHMLSQKLLVESALTHSPTETGFRWHKPARPDLIQLQCASHKMRPHVYLC